MGKTRSFFGCLMFFIVCIWWLSACTGRPYLIVDYQVPTASHQLAGQSVRLQINDLREDPYIFSPRASIEFRDFKERYALAWIMEDRSRILAGEHDLQNLFKEAFKKRLEVIGVSVVSGHQSSAPLFEVDLKEIKIDLQQRKWMANVSYRVSLSKDQNLIAHEKVVGTAERVKIIGRKGADTVISEIFSDMINRVDLIQLFEKAKLTSR
jgi:hypothetical protein